MNYLVSEPNYRITKCFSETLLTIEITKTEIFMNKPVYCDFQYQQFHCVRQKVDDIYKDLAQVFEIRFNTSNYEFDTPSPKGEN